MVFYCFNSNFRYAQPVILSHRVIPRVLAAEPDALVDPVTGHLDPERIWTEAMRDEKPGGHGDRAVAIGILDMAAWDLAAKLAGVSVQQLMAARSPAGIGTPLDKVWVYAAGGYYYPDRGIDALQDEMRGYVDLGYRTVKMKIGGAPLADDLARVEAVLDILPEGCSLAVDANGRFDTDEATAYADALAPLPLRWYEEPVDPLEFDAPTVLVYCHFDVQPTDPDDEWVSPPFEPRTADGRIYARGAGDDKGQLFMHLKAVEAWLATAERLPLNLRFFFEGDEEVGSEPIPTFIAEHADLLQADVCVVSDGDTFDDDGTPSIGYGLRGIAFWEIRVNGPAHDVHSGQYGGGVDNPANVLVRMLASLTDADGRFVVPGFYDRVVPPSPRALELADREPLRATGNRQTTEQK